MAASMAAVLLVAGTEGKRSALTHSRVMIHQPMGGAQGQASDIEITAREIQKLKKELYTIIADHSHTDFDKVWADSDRDYWMTAQEAKEYGLIDEVLSRKPAALLCIYFLLLFLGVLLSSNVYSFKYPSFLMRL